MIVPNIHGLYIYKQLPEADGIPEHGGSNVGHDSEMSVKGEGSLGFSLRDGTHLDGASLLRYLQF